MVTNPIIEKADLTAIEGGSCETIDALFEIQHQIKNLQEVEKELSQRLVTELVSLGMDEAVGKYGQKYGLSKKNNTYTFDLPREEYERLGILERCTPAPKLTKTELDKLLKKEIVNHQVVAHWEEKGWYKISNTGEIGIKRLETKPEDLLPF